MRGWVIQIECLHFLNPFPEQISNYGIFHKGKDDDLFVFVLRVRKEKQRKTLVRYSTNIC